MRLNALALSVALSGALWAGCAYSASNDAVGVWLTDEGKAKVEISPCGGGGQLCSKIIWLREPNDSKGKPLRDMRNKDDAQRGRPILGLPLLTNLAPSGPGAWAGNIYNPEDGNSYKATMQLLSKDRIKLQGCAMFGLICGTKMWARAQDEKIKSASPGAPGDAPPGKQRPVAKAPPPPAVEPDDQEQAAQPQHRDISAEKKPLPGGRIEAASQPRSSKGGVASATVTTSNAAGATVEAIVAKPVPAAAVANAAPVPAGPVAGEDMMFLAAPPPPEEAVSGTPMLLEGSSEALPTATAHAPLQNAAPGPTPPTDYPASDAAPAGNDAPANDESASAPDEEGDASAIPPLPTKAEEPDHTEPTPPLPVRAEQAADNQVAPLPKQRKKTARHEARKHAAKRAPSATRTAAKVSTKRVAAAPEKRAVGVAEAKPGKKREVLPWLKNGAKAGSSPSSSVPSQASAPAPAREASAKPGSFRALLSAPQ